MSTATADRAAVAAKLTEYVRANFVDERAMSELTVQTPLLRWGVLTSLNLTQLIAYVRTEFMIEIPFTALVSSNFRDIESIVDLLARLALEQTHGHNPC
jgi:acyl carrier protein